MSWHLSSSIDKTFTHHGAPSGGGLVNEATRRGASRRGRRLTLP
jgi:hypothetical protein